MKAVLFTLISVSFLASQHAFAQNTPDEIAKKFFEVYKSEGSNKAVEYIFATNKYEDDFRKAIDNLKERLHQTVVASGSFYGYELLSRKTAGQSLILLTFLVRHDREPLTFRIIFYKPADKWQTQSFDMDDKMGDELEEASKGGRTKED